MLYLYANDNYGVRDTVFDRAAEFLPDAVTHELIDGLWQRTKVDSSHAHRWLTPIESLARQLNDPELFEKARRCTEPELSSKSVMDVARICLASGEAKTALKWLKEIPESSQSMAFGYDRLLLEVYEKLNDKKAQAAVAWRIFRGHRSKDTLEVLLTATGRNQKKAIIEGETEKILRSMSLSLSDAQFLVDCGSLDDAEKYIVRSTGQLDGNYYGSILPLAESMEKHRRYFAATVLYRALLDSILKRAYSRAYHHGVDYLEKLDKFARKITGWDSLLPHQAYVQQLRRTHSRKVGFWAQYGQ